MEHARKLALVDPRQLEQGHLQHQHQQQQQQHAEYKDVQKLPVIRAKSVLSLDMKRILDDDTISDDVKAKLYRQTLDRYLRITNVAPLTESAVTINPLQLRRKASPSPDEGRKKTKKKQKTAAAKEQQQQKKTKKKRGKTSPSPSPTIILPRRSERLGRRWLDY